MGSLLLEVAWGVALVRHLDPIVRRSTHGHLGVTPFRRLNYLHAPDRYVVPSGAYTVAVTGPESCSHSAQLGLLSWPAGFPLHRLSLPGGPLWPSCQWGVTPGCAGDEDSVTPARPVPNRRSALRPTEKTTADPGSGRRLRSTQRRGVTAVAARWSRVRAPPRSRPRAPARRSSGRRRRCRGRGADVAPVASSGVG